MTKKNLRILSVLPCEKDNKNQFNFARKQIDEIRKIGGLHQVFFYEERTFSFSTLSYFFKLRKLYKDFNPDILHVHYGSIIGFLAFLGVTCKKVITFRGSDVNPTTERHYLKNFLANLLSQLAAFLSDHIICVSQELKSKILFNKTNISVISSGTDFNIHNSLEQKKCREELGLGVDQPYLLFNGEINPVKRYDLAKNVYELVKKEIPELKFITFNGNLLPDQIPSYLCAGDCLILTSDFEGSPNIIRESLLSGTPAVAFDVGDVQKQIGSFNKDWIISSRNIIDMANEVTKIIQNKTRVHNPELALKDYSLQEVSRKVCQIYEA